MVVGRLHKWHHNIVKSFFQRHNARWIFFFWLRIRQYGVVTMLPSPGDSAHALKPLQKATAQPPWGNPPAARCPSSSGKSRINWHWGRQSAHTHMTKIYSNLTLWSINIGTNINNDGILQNQAIIWRNKISNIFYNDKINSLQQWLPQILLYRYGHSHILKANYDKNHLGLHQETLVPQSKWHNHS